VRSHDVVISLLAVFADGVAVLLIVEDANLVATGCLGGGLEGRDENMLVVVGGDRAMRSLG
jgi:hypothetical protein